MLGTVARRYRDFASAEDAVQEASLAAAAQWARDGLPQDPPLADHDGLSPDGDHIRSESARRRRENQAALPELESVSHDVGRAPRARRARPHAVGQAADRRRRRALDAVRAHLLELAGDCQGAISDYRRAAVQPQISPSAITS
jgi:predicted RNA polymerase sigma factor